MEKSKCWIQKSYNIQNLKTLLPKRYPRKDWRFTGLEKREAIKAFQNGEPIYKVAKLLHCHHQTVKRWFLELSSEERFRCLIERGKRRIESLTEREKAYIAGFWDGEGTITISKTLILLISISNSNKEVLLFIEKKLGGTVYLKVKRGWKHKDISTWATSGWKAAAVIEILFPYFLVKRNHASLALSFQKAKLEKLKEQQVQLYFEMKKNNGRGKSKSEISKFEFLLKEKAEKLMMEKQNKLRKRRKKLKKREDRLKFRKVLSVRFKS